MSVKTISTAAVALVAFAANSVLCRLALGETAIDAASFTVIRLLSGALVLLVILRFANSKKGSSCRGSWPASAMLFLYAITFSSAYIRLDTGTGALILFGSVQITMILLSLISGNRLHRFEWLGVTVAFAGFLYLLFPGATAPSLIGFLLMAVAGVAWGIYTLQGRHSGNPLTDTAYNFLRTTPFVIILAIIVIKQAFYSPEGILLAVVSGGLASGVGYAIWYIALGGLSATQAAVIQLSVPVIAAFGGVLLLSEAITFRLTVSSIVILGGILLVVSGRSYSFPLRDA